MTGQELKDWRSKAGLTQAQLAERLGVTSNTVARWERDEMSIPTHVNLAAISKSPQTYVLRVMKENNLTFNEISKRAASVGHRINRSAIQQMANGLIHNPGIYTVKALAAGLGRPEAEVFEAFDVAVERKTRRDAEIEAIELNYLRLPPAKRQRLKPVIEMLSREIYYLLRE